MALVTAQRPVSRVSRLLGGSVFGVLLTTAGFGMAYLLLATPLRSVLSADQASGIGRQQVAIAIWAFALVAGGALLLAGTNRLALTLAILKAGEARGGPGARALAGKTDEVVVVRAAHTNEGRAIPELAIGPFGAAVIHALPPPREIRYVAGAWESHASGTWVRTESPIEEAMRDADRVRRWFSVADLDFVVRVYAAMVVTDPSVARSATCAVLTADQLPAWIAALPRQRSLTPARRLRLLSLASPATTAVPAPTTVGR